MLRGVAIFAAVVLVGSCGGSPASGPATTTGGTSTSSPSVATTTPAATTTTGPATTTTTTTVLPNVPDLLVAHQGGIAQVGRGIDWLTGVPVAVAYPDLRGGVVFLRDGDDPVTIEVLMEAGAEPSVLVAGARGDRLALVDVFLLDGAPTVAYTHSTRLPNDCSPADDECRWAYDITYLMFLDLTTGATVNLGAVGSFESDSLSYRFGADRYVSVWGPYGDPGSCIGYGSIAELMTGASADGWLTARSRCRIGPPRDCSDDMLCGWSVRATPSPDGSTFAYTGGGVTTPVQVQVVDAGTGDVGRDIVIGDPPSQSGSADFQSIEFDGTWIILGRSSSTGDLPSVLVRPDGTVEELEFAGRVTFWREGSP